VLALSLTTIAAAAAPPSEQVHASGNPVLTDRRYHSTAPAPFVPEDRLWILTGRESKCNG